MDQFQFVAGTVGRASANDHETIRLQVGQRGENCCIDQSKYRGVSTNAQGESEGGDSRESRVAAQLTQTVAYVLQEFVDHSHPPTVTAFFFDLPDVAELAQRRVVRLFWAHAAGNVLLDLLFEMKSQLIFHFLLGPAFMKERTQTEHQSLRIVEVALRRQLPNGGINPPLLAARFRMVRQT